MKSKDFEKFFTKASKTLEKALLCEDNFFILEDIIEGDNLEVDDESIPKLTRKLKFFDQ